MRRNKRGQNVAEYVMLMVVVLIALLASGVLGKARGVFQSYFTKAAGSIQP